MKAVILAGGKGTRLKPYTTHFPKPLMPVGDKPILEMVLCGLREAGIRDVLVTTGHLSEMIRAYFGDGSRWGMRVEYTVEDRPLGTAGPIKFVRDQLDSDFLVMNGDVLGDVDYGAMVGFHRSSGNVATVGAARRAQYIDFGIVELGQGGDFLSWTEKPTIPYLVSMGIYVFSPEALEFLPEEDFFNLPDFILRLWDNGQQVKGYVHEGYWLDIGRPEDYEQACRDFAERE